MQPAVGWNARHMFLQDDFLIVRVNMNQPQRMVQPFDELSFDFVIFLFVGENTAVMFKDDDVKRSKAEEGKFSTRKDKINN